MQKQKHPFSDYLDLVSEKLGGKVLFANDEFFAEKENLIKPGRGIFIPDKYTDHGKWMDGWETRRRRDPGHDWCIIQLAVPGVIEGLDIDTNHFLGNHPPFASVDAIKLDPGVELEENMIDNLDWKEILSMSSLDPGSEHFFKVNSTEVWTHLRLNIFPDGGVARFRAFGTVFKDWSKESTNLIIDLAAAKNGGKAKVCNDMFFSSMDNLIMPNRGVNMGDGWETKRNRTPGNRDWVVLKLCAKGTIRKVLVDTCHFKGNYPGFFSLDGISIEHDDVDFESQNWVSIIPKLPLTAHNEHFFEEELIASQPFTHVRFSIYPDGGVSRLRLFGNIS
ncbi:MAG: allantoicase [Bacteroidota bacterium]